MASAYIEFYHLLARKPEQRRAIMAGSFNEKRNTPNALTRLYRRDLKLAGSYLRKSASEEDRGAVERFIQKLHAFDIRYLRQILKEKKEVSFEILPDFVPYKARAEKKKKQ